MAAPRESFRSEEELIRERVAQWKRAQPVLREQRIKEVREADTMEAIASFAGVSQSLGPETSRRDYGLVEQQRWFAKIRNP